MSSERCVTGCYRRRIRYAIVRSMLQRSSSLRDKMARLAECRDPLREAGRQVEGAGATMSSCLTTARLSNSGVHVTTGRQEY